MRKILESCPTCGGAMEIRELHCRECGTEVRSQYEPCPFCRLSSDEASFLELFVQAKGNMRLLEQSLGVTYPTVRHKVEIIAARLRGSHPDTPVASKLRSRKGGALAPLAEVVAVKAAPAPKGRGTRKQRQ